MYFNIIKAITHTAYIMMNEENLKLFSLRSGRRQVHLPSPLLFNIELEVLMRAIRQQKESQKARKKEKKKEKRKSKLEWKNGRSQLFLFADDMIVYIEISKDYTKKKKTVRNDKGIQ